MDDVCVQASLPSGLRTFASLGHRRRKRFAVVCMTWHCVGVADAIINISIFPASSKIGSHVTLGKNTCTVGIHPLKMANFIAYDINISQRLWGNLALPESTFVRGSWQDV